MGLNPGLHGDRQATNCPQTTEWSIAGEDDQNST